MIFNIVGEEVGDIIIDFLNKIVLKFFYLGLWVVIEKGYFEEMILWFIVLWVKLDDYCKGKSFFNMV